MMFVKIDNDAVIKYPYTFNDLRGDNPNSIFAVDDQNNPIIFGDEQALLTFGIHPVQPTTPPDADPLHIVKESIPLKDDNGVWVQQWVQQPYSENEIQSCRDSKIKGIKAYADKLTQKGGYPVDVNGETKWFHSDTISRTQQLGLVLMGANIPANLQWKTMDGSFVPMTQALAQQIFTAAATQDIAIFNYSQELQLEVSTAANPFAVDIMTGWPATFTA